MRKLMLGLILILGLILSGCSQNVNDQVKEPPNKIEVPQKSITPGPSQGITVNKIPYEVLKDLPSQVKQPLTEKGYLVYKLEDKYVIVICAGEKRTGGHLINVIHVEDSNGKTSITVNEKSPAQGDITTQVITYPVVAIKIGNNVVPDFVVKDVKGEVFKKL